MAIDKYYAQYTADLKYADYYKRNRERIVEACRQEYKRLRPLECVDIEGMQWINPETVGRIMANMYHADVWATVAMALKLTADEDIREELYTAMRELKKTLTKGQQ